MAVKTIVGNYIKNDNEFVFIKKNTLIERLRKMRALNSKPADIGLTQYTCKSYSTDKKR